MTQPELDAGQYSVPDRSVIIVDQQGNAETEDSRIPHPAIHREQITPQNTLVQIDLDKLTSSSDDHTVYIVLSDFGLPFRTVAISKAYPTDYSYESRGNDPRKAFLERDDVSISAPSKGWETSRTERYTDGEDVDVGDVELSPGQHLFIAHNGDSSDLRTGFMYNETEIIVFHGAAWDTVDRVRGVEYYTPFLKISYEGRIIVLEAYDDTTAEVIYEKLISDADLPEVSGGQRTKEAVLEAALARNKQHLIEIQGQLQQAIFENERLKKREGAGGFTRTDPSPGAQRASSQDPYGYCQILGLNPEQLFSKPPGEAVKIVGSMRKVLATLYHQDINLHADETLLGKINDSADKVLTRLRTGFWGRN